MNFHLQNWCRDSPAGCRALARAKIAVVRYGSVASGNNSVVECDLAKVEVAGSNPVSRSILRSPDTRASFGWRANLDAKDVHHSGAAAKVDRRDERMNHLPSIVRVARPQPDHRCCRVN